MNKIRLSVFFAALTAAASITYGYAGSPSGRLLSADGGVLIQRGVQTAIGRSGSLIGVGDAVLTTDTGTTQWQMADDSLFAIAPSSGLKIDRYELPSSGNGSGVASYTLIQGAVHTLTGKIGRSVALNALEMPSATFAGFTGRFNPANLIKVAASPAAPYVLKSAFAKITTKGADYAAVQTEKQLAVLVNKGMVTVCSAAGCASPSAGNGVFVNCVGCKPVEVPGATLGLEDIVAGLSFRSSNPDVAIGAGLNDPRSEVAPAPGQNCLGVAVQLQAGACVPAGPGVPVSPN